MHLRWCIFAGFLPVALVTTTNRSDINMIMDYIMLTRGGLRRDGLRRIIHRIRVYHDHATCITCGLLRCAPSVGLLISLAALGGPVLVVGLPIMAGLRGGRCTVAAWLLQYYAVLAWGPCWQSDGLRCWSLTASGTAATHWAAALVDLYDDNEGSCGHMKPLKCNRRMRTVASSIVAAK